MRWMIECKIENYENNKQEQICVINDQTRFSEIVAKISSHYYWMQIRQPTVLEGEFCKKNGHQMSQIC